MTIQVPICSTACFYFFSLVKVLLFSEYFYLLSITLSLSISALATLTILHNLCSQQYFLNIIINKKRIISQNVFSANKIGIRILEIILFICKSLFTFYFLFSFPRQYFCRIMLKIKWLYTFQNIQHLSLSHLFLVFPLSYLKRF